MLARLHVIISSEKQEDCELIRNLLLKIHPSFSISPFNPAPQFKDHSECYATCQLNENEVQPLLDQLNNDWDGEFDDCICYGFNTKMFHKLVYYLDFQFFN